MLSRIYVNAGFMSIKDVCAFTTLGRSTIYSKLADKTFPLPVQISARRVAWRKKDIENWMKLLRQEMRKPINPRLIKKC